MKKHLAVIAAVVLLVLIPALSTAAQVSWVTDPATGCKIGWIHDQSTLVSASWSGPVVNGKAQGKGNLSLTIRSQNGKETQGQGEAEMIAGLLDGKVAIKWSIGVSYDGYYKAGQREGKGIMEFANGSIYEGEWKNNEANGHGVLKDATGKIIYEGEWADNKPVTSQQPKMAGAGATAREVSWAKLVYDPEISAQTREHCQRAVDTVDALFTKYKIVLSNPVTIVVTADREGEIRALMSYFNMSRAEAEAGAGKGLGSGRSSRTKSVILISNIPQFAIDPKVNLHVLSHELFHQVQYQYSRAKKLPMWLQEGSAELFADMAVETAGFESVTVHAQYVEQLIRKAAKIPDARELPYKWGYFLNQAYLLYQMADLMTYRLVGDNGFGKVLRYCQLLGNGSDPDMAFNTAFGRSMSDFLAEMNDYFTKLRH